MQPFLQQARPLIGVDPGQAKHITAVLLNSTEAYTALVHNQNAPAARAAFKARKRQVRGRHSKEMTLQARAERVQKYRKDRDREATPEGQNSIYDLIDNLRHRKAITSGTSIGEVSVDKPRESLKRHRLIQVYHAGCCILGATISKLVEAPQI